MGMDNGQLNWIAGVDRVFLMRPPHMSDSRAFEPFLAAMRERIRAMRSRLVARLNEAGQGRLVWLDDAHTASSA